MQVFVLVAILLQYSGLAVEGNAYFSNKLGIQQVLLYVLQMLAYSVQ